MREAETVWQRAVSLAQETGDREKAGMYEAAAAACEAHFGNAAAATRHALAGDSISYVGKRGQDGGPGGEAGCNRSGSGHEYVLGRSLWNHCRSRWQCVDGGDTHRRTHSPGDEESDEGGGGGRCRRVL